MKSHSVGQTCGLREATARFSVIYWGAVFLFLGMLGGLAGTGPFAGGIGTWLHYALCPVMTLGLSAILFRLYAWSSALRSSEDSLPLLVGLSFVLSIVAALAWAAIGQIGLALFLGPAPLIADWPAFGQDSAYGASLFFAWSCLIIILVFGFELSERARHLATVREEALSAQMRALRYQVNPHFLFNTLNSVAGLIEEGSATQAQSMVLSLSGFLRSTLSLDPLRDVPLAEELAVQADYLNIEQERFADRMAFHLDIADAAQGALVPSLILQPLIENAIKHGVGALSGRVNITLHAHRENHRLHLWVENETVPPGAQGIHGLKPPGLGVGLRNVAERLRTRFGEAAHFSAGPISPGRFRAAMELPWRQA